MRKHFETATPLQEADLKLADIENMAHSIRVKLKSRVDARNAINRLKKLVETAERHIAELP